MTETLVLSIRSDQDRRASISVQVDEKELCGEKVTNALATLLEEVNRALGQANRAQHATHRFELPPNDPARWGRALGEALPSAVVEALSARITRVPRERLELAVTLETSQEAEGIWLHRLPWETLVLPGIPGPVALEPHVSFYRRLPGHGGQSGAGPPLRVCFCAAVPDTQVIRPLEALDWGVEQAWMDQAIAPPARLVPADEGNLPYLKRLVNQSQPHVLHISGHGTGTHMVMENEIGLEEFVDIQTFSHFLDDLPDATRMVVLTQCRSAEQLVKEEGPELNGETFVSFAERAAKVRGMAVGMQFPITDRVASWWSRAFYQALAEGETPVRAMTTARRSVDKELRQVAKKTGARTGLAGWEWATPVLYVAGPPFGLIAASRTADEATCLVSPPRLRDVRAHRPVGSFVGRRRERRRLRQALDVCPHARQIDPMVGIVIRGLGGMGKSTLAAHLLEILVDPARAPGRIPWTHMVIEGYIRLPDLARRLADSRLARVLKVKKKLEAAAICDPETLNDVLLEVFRTLVDNEKRLALVFDDFEANLVPGDMRPGSTPDDPVHTRIPAPEVRRFLENLVRVAADARGNPLLLLFTSRYPVPLGQDTSRWLDLPLGPLGEGEQLHLIRRLAGDSPELATILAPGTDDTSSAVEGWGGHPGAIELATAAGAGLLRGRLSVCQQKLLAEVRDWLPESLQQWIAETSFRRETLKDRVLDRVEEYVSIPSLLENLDPASSSVLAGLAWFRAPFTRLALLAVARCFDIKPADPSDILNRLVASGLVAPARHDAHRARPAREDEAPVELLWVVPGLVKRHLTLSESTIPLVEAVAARHLAWRLQLEPISGEAALELTRIVATHALAGAEWSLAQSTIMRLLTHAYFAGRWVEGLAWGTALREALDGAPDLNREERWRAEGALGLRMGLLEESFGNPEKAQQTLTSAWQALVPDRFRDRPGEWIPAFLAEYDAEDQGLRARLSLASHLLHQVALLEGAQGRFDDARKRLEDSQTIVKKLGDLQGYGATLHELARLDQAQGRFEEARKRLEDSLTVDEYLRDWQGYQASLHELGRLDAAQGRLEEAQARLERSLTLEERLGDLRGRRATLQALASLELARGRFDEARKRLEEGLAIAERLEDLRGRAMCLHALAYLDQAQGRFEDALPRFVESLTITEKLGDREGQAATQVMLGQLLLGSDPHRALALLEGAAEIMVRMKHVDAERVREIVQNATLALVPSLAGADTEKTPSLRAHLTWIRGWARRLAGSTEASRTDFETALRLAHEAGREDAVRACQLHLDALQRNVWIAWDEVPMDQLKEGESA